jgi:hypothetical protein
MGDLKGFLIDLALNPDLVQSYAKDPQGTLDRAGLSGNERAAVLSGDSAQLRTALGRPDNDCMSQTAIAVRHAETGRSLRLAEILPLEQTVQLPHAIEMTFANGQIKKFTKGSTVTRHRMPSRRKPRRPVKKRR